MQLALVHMIVAHFDLPAAVEKRPSLVLRPAALVVARVVDPAAVVLQVAVEHLRLRGDAVPREKRLQLADAPRETAVVADLHLARRREPRERFRRAGRGQERSVRHQDKAVELLPPPGNGVDQRGQLGIEEDFPADELNPLDPVGEIERGHRVGDHLVHRQERRVVIERDAVAAQTAAQRTPQRRNDGEPAERQHRHPSPPGSCSAAGKRGESSRKPSQ